METIALAEARENFSKIIDRVTDSDEPIIITRYGKEAAALVSLKRFRNEDGFVASLDSWRQESSLSQECPFDNVRQKGEARAFEW